MFSFQMKSRDYKERNKSGGRMVLFVKEIFPEK